MYKVFVNDTPIIITSINKSESNFTFIDFKNIIFDDILKISKKKSTKGIILYSTDLERDWITFKKTFTVIPAAGGLVLNDKKETLFIYRNNVWDLPKGWIEKNETIENAAIREVKEECGVFNLSLKKKLITTYHIYYQNGFILKETHWFLMYTKHQSNLTPQLEEGITEVSFKNKDQINKALQNTYANIKLVYDSFLEDSI